MAVKIWTKEAKLNRSRGTGGREGGRKETWSTGLVDSLITNSILGRVFIPFSHYVSIKRVACLAPSRRIAKLDFRSKHLCSLCWLCGIWDRVEDDAFLR